jgi:hypothetical protein
MKRIFLIRCELVTSPQVFSEFFMRLNLSYRRCGGNANYLQVVKGLR